MRANIPTDDENVLRPITDDTPALDKITREQLELAAIGSNPDWEIIVKYLKARIDVFKNGLFGENLAGQDAAIIGQRFLAAQSVVAEFQSLIDQVEQTTETVKEAAKEAAKDVEQEPLVRPK